MEVIPVERPFVEGDLDGASADQHPGGDEQAQAPHLAGRQPKPPMPASEKEVQLQESEGEAEAVPPEVHPGDVKQDRIDPMDVRSEHGRLPAHAHQRPRSPSACEALTSIIIEQE